MTRVAAVRAAAWIVAGALLVGCGDDDGSGPPATEAKHIASLTDTNKFEWSLQPSSGLLVLNRPS